MAEYIMCCAIAILCISLGLMWHIEKFGKKLKEFGLEMVERGELLDRYEKVLTRLYDTILKDGHIQITETYLEELMKNPNVKLQIEKDGKMSVTINMEKEKNGKK